MQGLLLASAAAVCLAASSACLAEEGVFTVTYTGQNIGIWSEPDRSVYFGQSCDDGGGYFVSFTDDWRISGGAVETAEIACGDCDGEKPGAHLVERKQIGVEKGPFRVDLHASIYFEGHELEWFYEVGSGELKMFVDGEPQFKHVAGSGEPDIGRKYLALESGQRELKLSYSFYGSGGGEPALRIGACKIE